MRLPLDCTSVWASDVFLTNKRSKLQLLHLGLLLGLSKEGLQEHLPIIPPSLHHLDNDHTGHEQGHAVLLHEGEGRRDDHARRRVDGHHLRSTIRELQGEMVRTHDADLVLLSVVERALARSDLLHHPRKEASRRTQRA